MTSVLVPLLARTNAELGRRAHVLELAVERTLREDAVALALEPKVAGRAVSKAVELPDHNGNRRQST